MKLIIYGAGGLGREILSLIQRDYNETWQVVGFIDDNMINGDYIDGIEVLPKSVLEDNDHNIVFGIADPKVKQKIFNTLKHSGNIFFPRIVAKSAIIDPDVTLGEGVVIADFCWISKNVTIGDGSFVNVSTTLGHDVTIGSFTSIMPQCAISGHVNIGECSLIGAKSFILQGIKLGQNVVACAGSVIFSRVEDNEIVIGNPAHLLKKK